jgi:hypothetical protein
MNDLVTHCRNEYHKALDFFLKVQHDFRHVLCVGTPALIEEHRFKLITAFEAVSDWEVQCAKAYRGLIAKGDK